MKYCSATKSNILLKSAMEWINLRNMLSERSQAWNSTLLYDSTYGLGPASTSLWREKKNQECVSLERERTDWKGHEETCWGDRMFYTFFSCGG